MGAGVNPHRSSRAAYVECVAFGRLRDAGMVENERLTCSMGFGFRSWGKTMVT